MVLLEQKTVCIVKTWQIITFSSFGSEPGSFRQFLWHRKACSVHSAVYPEPRQQRSHMTWHERALPETPWTFVFYSELILFFLLLLLYQMFRDAHTQLWDHDLQLKRLIVDLQVCVVCSQIQELLLLFWIHSVAKDRGLKVVSGLWRQKGGWA